MVSITGPLAFCIVALPGVSQPVASCTTNGYEPAERPLKVGELWKVAPPSLEYM